MTGPASFVDYYAESLGHGRGVMRRDVVIEGVLVPELSGLDGSPAPLATVQRHERRVAL